MFSNLCLRLLLVKQPPHEHRNKLNIRPNLIQRSDKNSLGYTAPLPSVNGITFGAVSNETRLKSCMQNMQKLNKPKQEFIKFVQFLRAPVVKDGSACQPLKYDVVNCCFQQCCLTSSFYFK